jgi:L-aspartate oxidase
VACVTSPEDSFELHVKDTLEAGAGLCHEDVVNLVVREGPDRIKELVELGMSFDLREKPEGGTELDLGREGGHSKRRILHAHDFTGLEIEKTLVTAVERHPSITVLEDHMAIDLITTGKLGYATEDRVVGVYVLDEKSGEVLTLRSDRIVLATGGCGKVYLYTTNPDIASGDGVAMAWRAGAAVSNMEFIQFHPTCLFHPEAKSFLISEAVRGDGARLVDGQGTAFMAGYHALKDLAPRDIVARAMARDPQERHASVVDTFRRPPLPPRGPMVVQLLRLGGAVGAERRAAEQVVVLRVVRAAPWLHRCEQRGSLLIATLADQLVDRAQVAVGGCNQRRHAERGTGRDGRNASSRCDRRTVP